MTNQRLLYSIHDACTVIGVSRSQIYVLLTAEKLAAVKMGSKTLITADSIVNYVASLPKANIKVRGAQSAAA